MSTTEFTDPTPFNLYTIHNLTGGPPGLYGYSGTTVVGVPSGNDVRDTVETGNIEIRIHDSGANTVSVVTVGSAPWSHTSDYCYYTVNPAVNTSETLSVDISTGAANRRQIIIIRRQTF